MMALQSFSLYMQLLYTFWPHSILKFQPPFSNRERFTGVRMISVVKSFSEAHQAIKCIFLLLFQLLYNKNIQNSGQQFGQ